MDRRIRRSVVPRHAPTFPPWKRGTTVRRPNGQAKAADPDALELTEQDDTAFLAFLAGDLQARELDDNIPSYPEPS
jgi:hypothetical protein